MKNILKKVFICFLFVCAFMMISSMDIMAKSSVSEAFEVEVGTDKLPIKYNLVENQVVFNSNDEEVGNLESGIVSMNNGKTYNINQGKVLDELGNEVGVLNDNTITMNDSSIYTLSEVEVKERMNFSVDLKGLEETSNMYRWEHTFCYKIKGSSEVCELDITGEEGMEEKILSNQSYSYTFYDGHMPYYRGNLEFEYITFKNRFVCLDCAGEKEYVLNDISFNDSEIDYKYNPTLNVEYSDVDGKKYISHYTTNSDNLVYIKALFSSAGSSSLFSDGIPVYKMVNKVCKIDGSDCVDQIIEQVYASSDSNNQNPLKITPYIGNLSFYYNGNNLIRDSKFIIGFSGVNLKTELICLENCDDKRVVKNLVVADEVYYFNNPSLAEESEIDFNDGEEITFDKSREIKLTINDGLYEINQDSLKYYIVTPSPLFDSCSYGVEEGYSFTNGQPFVIGEGLNGGYCLYYKAEDVEGNVYTSGYHVFYFDNSAPVINVEQNGYLNTSYYNSVEVNIRLSDYSGINEAYYLWSTSLIEENSYLAIKEQGKIYNNSGKISSLNNVNQDGVYYLYILAFDELNNYKFYKSGNFNIDVTALTKEDIEVTVSNVEEYNSDPFIKVKVEEMAINEEFYCGLFKENTGIVVNDLNLVCKNDEKIVMPTNLEGIYYLWVNVHDKANNYSLLEVKGDLHIDTKVPIISYDILKDDDSYHITNEITVSVSDLSGVNETSLKYGWFLTSKTNVTSNDLVNNFENGGIVGYPKGVYGEYKLYVSALDNLGNQKFTSLDKIFKIDTDIIRISLIGEKNITIIRGQDYKEEGAKAYKGDVSSGGRVSSIMVEGEVNPNKVGTYYITYSSGEGELLVSVTRKVVVKSNLPYLLISIGLFVLGGAVISIRLFVKRKGIV